MHGLIVGLPLALMLWALLYGIDKASLDALPGLLAVGINAPLMIQLI